MSADSDAFNTVNQLPGLTAGEQQYLLTVARGEGFYGLGWSTPPAPGTLIASQTEALGLTGTEGAGSNNWGAVQGTGTAGSFPHLDHHADGSPYKGTFKRYTSPVEGAGDVARVLLKPNVKAAIAQGDLKGAVYAQHSNHYFELAPEKYLAAVKKNYDILTQSLKWPTLLQVKTAVGTIAASPLADGFPSSQSQADSSISHSTLRFGSQGSDVIEWQKLLNDNGFPTDDDGDFGPKTESRTRLFQVSKHLIADGVVGPLTWEAANG